MRFNRWTHSYEGHEVLITCKTHSDKGLIKAQKFGPQILLQCMATCNFPLLLILWSIIILVIKHNVVPLFYS